MVNISIGPVQSFKSTLTIGGKNTPYFRNSSFSEMMLGLETKIKTLQDARDTDRIAFLTGSGTLAMEAVVVNLLSKRDRVLLIKGGVFGARFDELLTLYRVPHTNIELNYGETLKIEHLNKYNPKDFTCFMVNLDETCTGNLYDLNLISSFCAKNNLLLIVDAISSFLADPISITESNIDALLISSQKAFACEPGISAVTLSQRAQDIVNNSRDRFVSYYLNFKDILLNMNRGQTPFTPAVNILYQLNARADDILAKGGVESEIKRVSHFAKETRKLLKSFGINTFAETPSNALTSFEVNNAPAFVKRLEEDFGIIVAPVGGDLKEHLVRIGHIGNISKSDFYQIKQALKTILTK